MHKSLLAVPAIGSYSAFLLLGLVAGFGLMRWRGVRLGMKGSHLDNLALVIAVSSLFGARVFSWWFYFPPGVSLWNALTHSSGGMVFYGGMLFGIAAALIYARLARLSLGNVLDAGAPGLALGLAFGRIGCFMAGCCWGDLCVDRGETAKLASPALAWQVQTIPAISRASFPLAVHFPSGTGAFEQHQELGLLDENSHRSRAVHPVQLYEAVLAFAACLGLHGGFARRRWPGQVFWVWVFLYGAIRFIMEFLRADNSPSYFGFTLAQAISAGLVIAAAVAVLVGLPASQALLIKAERYGNAK